MPLVNHRTGLLFLLTLGLFPFLDMAAAQAQNSSQWSRCAREGEPCYIPFPTTVAYGANGIWAKRRFQQPGQIHCGNATFGDPLVGARKSCHFLVSGFQSPSRREQWSTCAAEGEPCFVPYATTVAYGSNGVWTRRQVPGGTIDCSNRAFGDPLPGVRKSCRFAVR